jgi:hypothetical protein
MKQDHSIEQKNNLLFFLKRTVFYAIVILFVAVSFNFIKNLSTGQKIRPIEANKSDQLNVLDSGTVRGESSAQNETVYRSENFSAHQITFGGDTIVSQNEEQRDLSVYEVKSELLTTKSKEEIKLAVTWKTNRTTRCEIEYQKSGEKNGKKIGEEKFGYSHQAIIGKLNPSTAYTFTIRARDKWGNEKLSERFAFYTGAPNISIIDMLTGAVKDTFGWAVGK